MDLPAELTAKTRQPLIMATMYPAIDVWIAAVISCLMPASLQFDQLTE